MQWFQVLWGNPDFKNWAQQEGEGSSDKRARMPKQDGRKHSQAGKDRVKNL